MFKDAKEEKKAKGVAPSKQGKHMNIARNEERCESSTRTPQSCISQVVTSKQALGGMDANAQANGLKD